MDTDPDTDPELASSSLENTNNFQKTFGNLDEALQYEKFWSNQETTIIASFQVSLGGSRKYLVTSRNKFWEFYINLKSKKFYEVIPSHRPVKLYFDLEYEKQNNSNKDGVWMTGQLIELVNLHLREKYDYENSIEDVLVLESTTDHKFSIHLIFIEVLFRNVQEVKNFVTNFVNEVNKKEPGLFEVYKKSKKVSFIDQSVYSNKQNFRMYLSEKLGKSTPLTVSEMDVSTLKLFRENQSEKLVLQQEVFFSSLITNVKASRLPLLCEENYISRSALNITPCGDHDSVVSGTSTSISTSACPCPSPYVEVDNFLTTITKPDGYIRSWKYYRENDVFSYIIGNNRYCENVKRQHTSNHVYYTLCLKTFSVRQRCFSCKSFESDPIYLPSNLLNWLDMMDAWD